MGESRDAVHVANSSWSNLHSLWWTLRRLSMTRWPGQQHTRVTRRFPHGRSTYYMIYTPSRSVVQYSIAQFASPWYRYGRSLVGDLSSSEQFRCHGSPSARGGHSISRDSYWLHYQRACSHTTVPYATQPTCTDVHVGASNNCIEWCYEADHKNRLSTHIHTPSWGEITF